MSVTIYHNPRCSKSRETLALLEEQGHKPKVIEYLQTPPDAQTLTAIVGKLGIPARKLLRTKEAAYLENGLDNDKLTDAQIISAIVKHPILMERPIVLANVKAAIGRPPENVLEIL
jgi:arsenate reductase (glutaredoxin)